MDSKDIGQLIDSLDTEVDANTEAAWSAEIRRRFEDLNSGRAQTVPWVEARRRIRLAVQAQALRGFLKGIDTSIER